MAQSEQRADGYIRFRCSQCGQRLKIRDTFEGGVVIPCPNCQASVVTPMANLESITSGAREGEPEWLDQVTVDPAEVRRSFHQKQREEQAAQSPSAARKRGFGSAEAAFSRIVELDQLLAAVRGIDDKVMGRIQRLYRKEDTSSSSRAQRIEELAVRRRKDLQDMFKNKLAIIRRELAPLQANHERLGTRDLRRLEGLTLALEAVQLCVRYIYGIDF